MERSRSAVQPADHRALAAMMLAEAVSRGIRPDDHQRVESWAHKLGLTGSEAIARLTEE